MVIGSFSAIRFGVILGGVLLALSILSLKAYKRGQPSPQALKGQAGYVNFHSPNSVPPFPSVHGCLTMSSLQQLRKLVSASSPAQAPYAQALSLASVV
ncbi:hypothetical protein RIF29_38674 [Crotalaria pallida]|uniref:Uncharacterized protein n=1 Tax=Crotalaria pallida TaxID=3830 RepID=A0AAN9E0N7_CROPI